MFNNYILTETNVLLLMKSNVMGLTAPPSHYELGDGYMTVSHKVNNNEKYEIMRCKIYNYYNIISYIMICY